MTPGRFTGMIALLGATLAVLGLHTALAQDTPRRGGELVFMVPAEPPSYDGHREGTFGTVHPLAPHYNTLLRIDPTDRTGTRPVPDLAESWTISPDGPTYTFKIRPGVRFHDGSPMTSRDVKASSSRPAPSPQERKRHLRAFEKRLLDEEVHYLLTLQWHRIVPMSARVRGWTITPSHFLNQQLDGV